MRMESHKKRTSGLKARGNLWFKSEEEGTRYITPRLFFFCGWWQGRYLKWSFFFFFFVFSLFFFLSFFGDDKEGISTSQPPSPPPPTLFLIFFLFPFSFTPPFFPFSFYADHSINFQIKTYKKEKNKNILFNSKSKSFNSNRVSNSFSFSYYLTFHNIKYFPNGGPEGLNQAAPFVCICY